MPVDLEILRVDKRRVCDVEDVCVSRTPTVGKAFQQFSSEIAQVTQYLLVSLFRLQSSAGRSIAPIAYTSRIAPVTTVCLVPSTCEDTRAGRYCARFFVFARRNGGVRWGEEEISLMYLAELKTKPQMLLKTLRLWGPRSPPIACLIEGGSKKGYKCSVEQAWMTRDVLALVARGWGVRGR